MGAKQYIGGSGGGSINPNANFVAIGAEYCEPDLEGLNTGRRLVKQMDINPYSSTFQTERIFVVAAVSDSCPISTDAFFKPTGNKRCVRDADNRHTGGTEVEEKDVNPRSATFNTSQWIAGGDNLSLCPLPELPFLRVLAENIDAGALAFTISASIKDGAGQLFTVTRISTGSDVNFADLFQGFGSYTIVNVKIVYSAGVATGKFISRIYSAGIFDRNFLQGDPVNIPAGGVCTLDDVTEYALTLNTNKVIHFVFTDRIAQGQFIADRTQPFTRNNCGDGYVGGAVNFTKPYRSSDSQAAANALRDNDNANYLIEGQAFANNAFNGATCTVDTSYSEVYFVLEPFEKFLKVSGENPVDAPIVLSVNYNVVNTDSFGNPINTTGPFNKQFTMPAGQTEKISTGIIGGDYFRIDILDFTFTPRYSGSNKILINGHNIIP